MRIAIHQPDYIPYLGYFYKISKADLFIYLDDVQFSNDNLHHRNTIKTPQGIKRLVIPLEYHFKDTIDVVRTKDELGWKEKHLALLSANYSKAKYYKEIFPLIKELLLTRYDNLADMNMTINHFILSGFGLHTAIVKASELNVNTKKEQRILDICTLLKVNEYYSGLGASGYQKEEDFKDRGIELTYTDYKAFEYPQQWEGFKSNLSVLDFLFNCGFDWNRVIEGVRKDEGL